MASIVNKERVPYRIWDKVNGVWNELKFKTNAKSVDANDGNTLEYKVGAINGITDSLVSESSSIAASSKAVKTLNDSLGGLSFGYDSASGKYGYWKKEAGTDVFVPFKSGKEYIEPISVSGKNTKTYILEYDDEYEVLLIVYNGYYSPRKITISTSNDGNNYTDVYSNVLFADIGTVLATDNDNYHLILLNQTLSAKYIKFVVNSGNYSQCGTASAILI